MPRPKRSKTKPTRGPKSLPSGLLLSGSTFAIQVQGRLGSVVSEGHGWCAELWPVAFESYSQRRPRLSVRRGETRQSSCAYRPV